MSPLYELSFQRKGELQTETVQVVDAAQVWRLGRERYPPCISVVLRRDGGRDGSAAGAIQTPLNRSASKLPGMELRLESRALDEPIEASP